MLMMAMKVGLRECELRLKQSEQARKGTRCASSVAPGARTRCKIECIDSEGLSLARRGLNACLTF